MEKESKYSAVLLETNDGKLIFHHRDNKPNIANPDMVGVFGGGVEDGETYEEAAIREIKEELDLDLAIEDLHFLAIYNKTKERHGNDEICHVFVVKNVDVSKLKLKEDEGQGIISISKDDNWDDVKLTIMANDMLREYFQK
jgi:8-oxo-dGTP pyrophosphatase MutT (NUDIX family)